jgi:hypothetical protein
VLIALPCERLERLIDDAVFQAAPTVTGVAYLRAVPMAALDLYINRQLPDLPNEHVNLTGSRYGLSFIDVSRVWPGYSNSVLNIIASDFVGLANLTQGAATGAIIDELMRYLPMLQRADIDHYWFQSNVSEPLFMNDVGIWRYRATASCELENMFIAGDYCKSHVDLVSMEGAVVTGLHAAEAVRAAEGVGAPIVVVTPERLRRWLYVIARVALLPLAAMAKAWVMGSGEDATVRRDSGVEV